MFVCPATKPNIKYLLFVAGSRHRNLILAMLQWYITHRRTVKHVNQQPTKQNSNFKSTRAGWLFLPPSLPQAPRCLLCFDWRSLIINENHYLQRWQLTARRNSNLASYHCNCRKDLTGEINPFTRNYNHSSPEPPWPVPKFTFAWPLMLAAGPCEISAYFYYTTVQYRDTTVARKCHGHVPAANTIPASLSVLVCLWRIPTYVQYI